MLITHLLTHTQLSFFDATHPTISAGGSNDLTLKLNLKIKPIRVRCGKLFST